MTKETRIADAFSNVPPMQHHGSVCFVVPSWKSPTTWKSRSNRGARSQSSQPNHPNRSRLWCSLILEILFPR